YFQLSDRAGDPGGEAGSSGILTKRTQFRNWVIEVERSSGFGLAGCRGGTVPCQSSKAKVDHNNEKGPGRDYARSPPYGLIAGEQDLAFYLCVKESLGARGLSRSSRPESQSST